ncbi:unnamed protein product [Prorocentrum cordatum]|uniref:Uncharacterized protein n=1 Tax=Prorocentrum cordatum TaxID=2364126 RepID=A0ABN9UKR0_9DINO|nr:unnamed protein product [Polarella glacialis]
MALPGSSLQEYNSEPVHWFDSLRQQREQLIQQIQREEESKCEIQKQVSILTDALRKMSEGLARKKQVRSEYDKTIQKTEAAYMQILGSSETLPCATQSKTASLARVDVEGVMAGEPPRKRRCAVDPGVARVNQMLWESGPVAQEMLEREAAHAGLPIDALFYTGSG